MRSKTLRAAVVGGGAFGEVHLHTLRSMPQIEIAGVYTLEPPRGEELVGRYGGRSYASLEELADDPSVDIVTIATPEFAHLEPFRVLAAKEKALYLEKPLATDLNEARQILELSRPLVAMSGHCLRFEHRLAQVFQSLAGVKKHHLSLRGRRTRAEKRIYGRVHPAYCMLCHEIELSNAFAESPFRRVLAMETRFSEGQADGITILIEYENGITSSVEGGWYLPEQNGILENDFISVLSERGIHEIAMPHLGFYSLDGQGVSVPNLFYGHSIYGTEYGPLRAAFDYLARCVSNGTTPEISTIEDGFRAVEVIDAALRSVAENRWISRS
jgi:predicted dehydrogenase